MMKLSDSRYCYEVSEQLTEAMAERDAAKENLATVDANLSYKWRKSLGKESKARVTDTMVATMVQTSEDHEKAFNDYLIAKTKAERLQVLKESFQQRSYMLRDLVTLYSANYYEDASLKPTAAQDAAHYAANRQRIANFKEAKRR